MNGGWEPINEMNDYRKTRMNELPITIDDDHDDKTRYLEFDDTRHQTGNELDNVNEYAVAPIDDDNWINDD